MSGFVFGGIAPHGFSIIGEIAGDEYELFKPTRDAMEMFGKKLISHNVDTIVVLTPHGLRLEGQNAIYTTECCRGTLSQFGKTVESEFMCDRELASSILASSLREGIPAVGCNYGALSGELSNIEMDWGTMIPLWFCTKDNLKKPEIVVIGPSRDCSKEQLVDLGVIVAKEAENSGKNVAIIASADQGHAHHPDGPYGFNPLSKVYDDTMVDLIINNELHELLTINDDLVKHALPDGLWQMLILYGALTTKPLKGEFLSYDCPTYFGMLVATYE